METLIGSRDRSGFTVSLRLERTARVTTPIAKGVAVRFGLGACVRSGYLYSGLCNAADASADARTSGCGIIFTFCFEYAQVTRRRLWRLLVCRCAGIGVGVRYELVPAWGELLPQDTRDQ